MDTIILKSRVKLTAAGTVVLARGVHKVIKKNNDIHYPWKGTRHCFKASDINIVNFKSPLVTEFTYPKSSGFWLANSIMPMPWRLQIFTLFHWLEIIWGTQKAAGLKALGKLNQLNIKSVGAGASCSI